MNDQEKLNQEKIEEVNEVNEQITIKKNPIKEFFKPFLVVCKKLFDWTRRAIFGGSRTLYSDDPTMVEKLESPGKIAVKSFFRKKLQVTALIVLVSMFIFVFVGPLFIKIDYSADATQMNMNPTLALRSVPKGLKNNIKSISSYGVFSVGVSNDNDLYVWGSSKDPISGLDFKKLPDELVGKKVAFASAGKDHAIAITTEGKVVGWGSNSLAQYGNLGIEDSSKVYEPDELINGTIDTTKVKQLECGNQGTAIVMEDGSFYIWGNKNSINNLLELREWQQECIDNGVSTNVQKIVFSNSYAICLLKDGSLYSGYKQVLSTKKFDGKVVKDIAADGYSFGGILSDGKILMTGVFEYGQNEVPELEAGDKFVSISAGSRHYTAVTENGIAYSWGNDFYKQTKVSGIKGVSKTFSVSNQSYFVDAEGKLIKSSGLKGFIMGTDKQGRDLFARIVHGGKMTMTIGAVAVIISTIIAIIIGCISGYFGGWVDMLLMRVTEIFSALPFLPFAMMLSVVISNYNISENKRIFIIMVILGLLSWTGLAHMIRGQVLAEREKEFVIAAKAMGVKESRIAFKHILPNVVSIILVSVTLDFAGCMLTESSLSYLGFGVQQPQPTWGNLLNGCNNSIVIKYYWWQWLYPALFLGIATICVNIIGDGLRDVLDPKSSSER